MKRLAVLLAIAACGAPAREISDAPDSDGPLDPDAPITDGPTDAPGDAPPPGTGDPVAELANVPPKCANGWCYFNPKPAGIGYSRIFDTGPDNLWMLGGLTGLSIVLQWNGTSWVVHRPVRDPALQVELEDSFPASIGGTSASNMWLLYGGTVQHWDGQVWEIKDTFNQSAPVRYNNVWVDPDGVPWVTTSQGKIRRYINNAWSEISVGCNCSLGSIFGTGVNDVFVTTLGAVIHFDGQSFDVVFDETLGSFAGAERDVWASGEGTIAHWDGDAFTEIAAPIGANSVVSATTHLSRNDVWWTGAGFLHWDGEEISATPVDEEATWGANCCPGAGANRIVDGRWWAAGGRGGIYNKVSPTTLQPLVDLRITGSSMWGTSADDMYFGGPNEIHHWNGSTWEVIAVGGSVQGVPGGGLGGTLEIFGVNTLRNEQGTGENINVMIHFDGVSWTQTELSRSPGNDNFNAFNIFALGPDEAMLISLDGNALHYHDGVFDPISTGTTEGLRGITGTSDHLYIIATRGIVLEWHRANPTVFTRDTTFPTLNIPDASNDLVRVHTAGDVFWITRGNHDQVYRKAGTGAWETIDLPFFGFKLVAISADEAIVFGNDATSSARWNGTAFVYETVPMNVVSAAYALPDGTVFAVGSEGILIRE